MNYSDYIIYADESGDPGLASVDPSYPVFALNFCLFRKARYAAALPAMAAFKFAHFGHDQVVLHEHDMRRRNPPFSLLHDERNRAAFMAGLNRLIATTDFTIIAAVIDKRRLLTQGVNLPNLYETAFGLCLEKAYQFLESRGQYDLKTHVVIERRDIREDNRLEQAFRRMQEGENNSHQPLSVFEIVFADKKSNSTGLQIADLTARPIGRHVIVPEQANRAWDLLEPKLFRNPQGETAGWGLTIIPQ